MTWISLWQFSSVIVMQMSGHTHHDDFRLQYAATPSQQQTQPYGAVLLTPSVSPIYANNPSFRVLRTNAEVLSRCLATPTCLCTRCLYTCLENEQYDHQAGLPPWSIVDYTQVFMDLWLANTKVRSLCDICVLISSLSFCSDMVSFVMVAACVCGNESFPLRPCLSFGFP